MHDESSDNTIHSRGALIEEPLDLSRPNGKKGGVWISHYWKCSVCGHTIHKDTKGMDYGNCYISYEDKPPNWSWVGGDLVCDKHRIGIDEPRPKDELFEPDKTGCFKGGGYIETFTGKKFNIMDPNPDDVELEDIAHAMSMCCRYAGHCRDFYSVAEHSCHVHNALRHNPDEDVRRAALLHDASEAYLGDLARPLKVGLVDYRSLEHAVQEAIYDRFDVLHNSDVHGIVKQIDNAALKAEAAQLVHSGGKDWMLDGVDDIALQVHNWTPAEAKKQFLMQCHIEGIK